MNEEPVTVDRAVEKFNNMADCCKEMSNLELRGEDVVKCRVCGQRNLLNGRKMPDAAAE